MITIFNNTDKKIEVPFNTLSEKRSFVFAPNQTQYIPKSILKVNFEKEVEKLELSFIKTGKIDKPNEKVRLSSVKTSEIDKPNEKVRLSSVKTSKIDKPVDRIIDEDVETLKVENTEQTLTIEKKVRKQKNKG